MDWNYVKQGLTVQEINVALFVSAWIEMVHIYCLGGNKQGRTLCECVDWNIGDYFQINGSN